MTIPSQQTRITHPNGTGQVETRQLLTIHDVRDARNNPTTIRACVEIDGKYIYGTLLAAYRWQQTDLMRLTIKTAVSVVTVETLIMC